MSAQIREYEELKMEASRQAARYLQELDSVNREQKADQDRLDNEMRRKGELENKHRQKVTLTAAQSIWSSSFVTNCVRFVARGTSGTRP